MKHGSPRNRGSADAYYGRSRDPQKWMDLLGCPRVGKESMTPEEIKEYNEGYDNEDDRKNWD